MKVWKFSSLKFFPAFKTSDTSARLAGRPPFFFRKSCKEIFMQFNLQLLFNIFKMQVGYFSGAENDCSDFLRRNSFLVFPHETKDLGLSAEQILQEFFLTVLNLFFIMAICRF